MNGAAALFGSAGWLLADDDLEPLFAPEAEIRAIVAFELALARARHAVGDIPPDALAAIEEACLETSFEDAVLAEGLKRDGVIIPALVSHMRDRLGTHGPAFHKGATSQDAIDTGLMLRLKAAVTILGSRLTDLLQSLGDFETKAGSSAVMARTRHQDALPITLKDRIDSWSRPLQRLSGAVPETFPVQLGGPVGKRTEAFGSHHDAISRSIATELGLSPSEASWHTDRSPILAVARWCADVAAAIGKIGTDVALMAQNPVAEVRLPGGASSSMPHKNNPVQAEHLVTLAKFVAGHLAMPEGNAIHENERSGTAWTLEWLTLPQVVIGAGASLGIATGMLLRLEGPPA